MHSSTGTTLYVAVFWVTHAAITAFLTAGLLVAPYYLVLLIRRWLARRLSV